MDHERREVFDTAIDALADVILERWPHRVIPTFPPGAIVTMFNDHGNTVKEDVIWALEEAARRTER